MALEPLRLDDLDWQGMVDAIRRRIPAASGGNWTFHAPVDPGVTLLELYAALLEQRVFQLDQTPDALRRAALALLGETPQPTAVATTVLEIKGDPFQAVEEGAEMRLCGRMPGLVFTTGRRLDTPGEPLITLLPLDHVELSVGGRDRTQDFLHGRLVRLFPAGGGPAEVRIVLWLEREIPALPPGASFGLLVEIDAPARIQPSWDLEAVDAPLPAQVSWEYPARAADGSIRFRPFPWVADGTGGLRRSGLVRLAIPDDWYSEPEPDGQPRGYAVHLRVARATWSAPPRLAGLTVNAVEAGHRRRTREHPLRLDVLPLPGLEIALANLPVAEAEKDHPPLETTIELELRERVHGPQKWSPTPDLAFHGPDERVFEVDRRLGVLRFGDGLTGRQPVLDRLRPGDPEDRNGTVRYEVGGGPEGNLGRGLKWSGEDGLKAKNVVSARGGAEAQALTAARDATAASLRRPTRAVLRRDFEELARTTPGVAIARARALSSTLGS